MSQVDRATFIRTAGAASLALTASPALAAPLRGFRYNLSSPYNIPQKIANIADLSTLYQMLGLANLITTLSGTGPFTVFASTNEAFSTLPANQMKHLMKDIPKLTKLLTYSVLNQEVMLQQFVTGDYTTMEGESVDIVVVQPNSVVTVNRARLIIPNVTASNGVIHIIDKVLTKVIHKPN